MGYDDDECVSCYGVGACNNSTKRGGHICGKCVEEFQKIGIYRFHSQLGKFIDPNPEANCVLCEKKGTLFYAPCCKNCKGMNVIEK